MIKIHKSKTANTRSCDFANATTRDLLESSLQHIGDVGRGLAFFSALITEAAVRHDYDKLTEIDWFHADFVTGFEETGWWDNHRRIHRHHLAQEDGIPENVNLVDVIEYIVDCVMAAKARTGEVYDLKFTPELLENAFKNTVTLLKGNVCVVEEELEMPGIQKYVDLWNLEHPIGTKVTRYKLIDPLRDPERTETVSRAWVMGGHTAVVLVAGVGCAVSLDSIRVREDEV